jgi:hypothetical protein
MANKVAGIDVHKKVLMVVVMDAHTPKLKPERRRFATMPRELQHKTPGSNGEGGDFRRCCNGQLLILFPACLDQCRSVGLMNRA